MLNPKELTGLTFFSGLEAADVAYLAEIATRRTYDAGETIFSEGDPPGSLRILVGGLVSMRQQLKSSDHDSQMTSLSEPGDVFGIAALVGADHIYPASAFCLEETEVIEIDAERLFALFDEKPDAGVRILLRFAQHLSARLGSAREQIRSRVRRGLISQG